MALVREIEGIKINGQTLSIENKVGHTIGTPKIETKTHNVGGSYHMVKRVDSSELYDIIELKVTKDDRNLEILRTMSKNTNNGGSNTIELIRPNGIPNLKLEDGALVTELSLPEDGFTFDVTIHAFNNNTTY